MDRNPCWETMDKRFCTKQRPSQHLLQILLRGPIISCDDPDSLFAFARNCQTAVELQQHNPGLLASLEEQTTQDTIVRRLEQRLYVEWHKHRREQFQADTHVPFRRFVSWLDTQAEIYLDCQNTATNGRESISDKPLISTPSKIQQGNQERKANSATPSNSSFNKTNWSRRHDATAWRPQRGNDQNRSRQRNFSARQPTTPGNPLHESTRASSPDTSEQISRIDEISCAWCRDKKLNYNHLTAACPTFSQAAAPDKWKVVDKYRLCSRCLEGYHRYSECYLSLRRCSSCNRDHHELIGCRSRRNSSPSRPGQ